jgi:hypothetical protein
VSKLSDQELLREVRGAAARERDALRCRAHNVHEAELYFGTRLPTLVRETRDPAYRRFELCSVWTEFAEGW